MSLIDYSSTPLNSIPIPVGRLHLGHCIGCLLLRGVQLRLHLLQVCGLKVGFGLGADDRIGRYFNCNARAQHTWGYHDRFDKKKHVKEYSALIQNPLNIASDSHALAVHSEFKHSNPFTSEEPRHETGQ